MKPIMTILGVVTMAVLTGCSRPGVKDARADASAQMKKAREALNAEVDRDLASTKKTLDEARASLTKVDDKAAAAYREALDEVARARDAASQTLAKAANAPDDTFDAVGKETRQAAAGVRRAARRVAALTGDVKGDFVREADSVLREIRADVNTMEKKAARADGAARKDLEKLTADFKKASEAAAKSLDKASNAAGDGWKESRHEVNQRLLELRSRMRKASKAFSQTPPAR